MSQSSAKAADLSSQAAERRRGDSTTHGERMKVAITGASGLVGTELSKLLQREGHSVIPVVRRKADHEQIAWRPSEGRIDPKDFEGIDAVVHLGGDNIAEGRWNAEKKRLIRDSRVKSTELLSKTLAGLDQKPRVFVCASAIGIYGDQRPDAVDEDAGKGEGFLADVCQDWEDACKATRDAGIRTVNVRIGVVLSKNGGALAKMLTPFKMCAGGIIGSGQQIWSWVSIDDVVGAINHAIENESIDGPLNATSPNASSNAQFTKALGHVLGRPTLIPMPAFAARMALGEMADALLLSSSRVKPKKLLETGYDFKHEDLEATLRALLK